MGCAGGRRPGRGSDTYNVFALLLTTEFGVRRRRLINHFAAHDEQIELDCTCDHFAILLALYKRIIICIHSIYVYKISLTANIIIESSLFDHVSFEEIEHSITVGSIA